MSEKNIKHNSKQGLKRNAMLWLLVLTSSVLLSIPFLYPHLGLVALVAFIPLFAAEHIATENKKRHFWLHYYVAFLVWNVFTTSWIYYATLPGMIAAVTLNALQMAVIFRLFRWVKTLSKGFLPYLFFITTWLAWEHAYFNWDVSWPWLVLGNSFSTSIKCIQWYEYTGALGGSLWVLLVNALAFRLIRLIIDKKRYIISAGSLALLIVLPLTLSLVIYYTYKEQAFEPSIGDGSRKFTVLQPNIDPYTDKFRGLTQQQQNTILLQLADEALGVTEAPLQSQPSHFIITPETFVSRPPLIIEENPLSNPTFLRFRNYLESRNSSGNNLNLIFGAVTDKFYTNYQTVFDGARAVPPTETARHISNMDLWFDRSNTAIFMDNKGDYEFYNKSKLVVLVEKTPYKKLFNLMSYFAIDLGGSLGSYAPQQEREVFVTTDSVKIGTAICYESVYGDYYRDYILKGAQVMSIITNDGWWDDTPGYKQHLSYASLRAIETRRSIARSANTGISALINQRGDIIANTAWWERDYINGTLKLNDKITLFVKYGDIIGRVSKFLFFLLALMAISRFISRKYIVKEPFTE